MKSPERDTARGARIKYVRTELLQINSQEKFAELIGGVTRGAVGNWERGLDIGLESLIKIANKADISLEWLAYNRGPRPRASNDIITHSNDAYREELVRIYDSLPPQLKELLAQQARAIAATALSLEDTRDSPSKADPADE